ncbi:uncharacterized protein RBU33_017902 [Hipposideros larvatus]
MIRAPNTREESISGGNGLTCGGSNESKKMTQETTGHVATKLTEEETACEKDMIRAPNTGEESISGGNGLSCGASIESKKMTQETTGHEETKRTEEETACEKDMIRAPNTGEESISGGNGLTCGGSNESKKMTQETTGHVATKLTEEETACEKDMIRAPNTGEESISGGNGLSCGASIESKKMTQETTGHEETKRTEEETACEKDMIRAPNTGEESISGGNGLSCGASIESKKMTQETTGHEETKHTEEETACEKDMIRAPNTREESISGGNGLTCGGSNESKKMTQETTGHVATKLTEEETACEKDMIRAPNTGEESISGGNGLSCGASIESKKMTQETTGHEETKRTEEETACEKDMIRAPNTGEESISGGNGLSCGASIESKKMTQETTGHEETKHTEEERLVSLCNIVMREPLIVAAKFRSSIFHAACFSISE